MLVEICKKNEKSFSPSLHNKTAGAVVEDIATLLIKELNLPMTQSEFVDMYNKITITKCSDIDFMPGDTLSFA